MVSVESECVLGGKDGLLVIGSDGRQAREGLGEPSKNRRFGDGVESLEFTRGRQVVPNLRHEGVRWVQGEPADLHSDSIVEPRQGQDGDEERRETEANDQKNRCRHGGRPDQVLNDLVPR